MDKTLDRYQKIYTFSHKLVAHNINTTVVNGRGGVYRLPEAVVYCWAGDLVEHPKLPSPGLESAKA